MSGGGHSTGGILVLTSIKEWCKDILIRVEVATQWSELGHSKNPYIQ